MSTDTNARTERLQAARSQLSPYLAALVDIGGLHAGTLHAEETTLEHLFCALMSREDSAASQAVAHAFADPETLYDEGLAICTGWLVVGSKSTLPFSPRAVEALSAAHRERAGQDVEPAMIARAALARISDEQRARVSDHLGASADSAAIEMPAARPEIGGASPFGDFSGNGKQALARANHSAAGLDARAIGPVHLILGALSVDAAALPGEIRPTRLRAAWGDLHRDASASPPPALPSAELAAFLEGLRAGADSLDCLTALQSAGSTEVNEILTRNRITRPFLDRAQGAFSDPEDLPEPI